MAFAIIIILYVKNFNSGIRLKDKISKSSVHKKQGILAHFFVHFKVPQKYVSIELLSTRILKYGIVLVLDNL